MGAEVPITLGLGASYSRNARERNQPGLSARDSKKVEASARQVSIWPMSASNLRGSRNSPSFLLR